MEAPSSLVLGEHGGIAGAEPETGLAFPVVAEAVDPFEFHCSMAVNKVGEHAATSYC